MPLGQELGHCCILLPLIFKQALQNQIQAEVAVSDLWSQSAALTGSTGRLLQSDGRSMLARQTHWITAQLTRQQQAGLDAQC